jgi:cardiolipin synthase
MPCADAPPTNRDRARVESQGKEGSGRRRRSSPDSRAFAEDVPEGSPPAAQPKIWRERLNSATSQVGFALNPADQAEGSAARVRTPRHELLLYSDPEPLFEALERAIAAASRRVWLETYIYRDDVLGTRFAEYLVAAARRGLDVRLLYDPQGSRGARSAFFEHLRRAGVAVRAYRPWRLARRRWTYWPRDHGRIIIVDERAHTGGINWGKEWASSAKGGDDWHDVSLGVQGPAVDDFAAAFSLRWEEASSQTRVADHAGRDDADVQLIADSPASTSMILQRFCAAVQQARRRVWLENSYCVPPRVLLSDLSSAVQRGVDVRILVPGSSDLPSVQAVTRGEFPAWKQSGFDVYEYQPRIMHSKFALVDDAWATVGTFNAMSPGVWWANETNVIVRDGAFVAELARIFEADVMHSRRVDETTMVGASWPAQLRDRALAAAYRATERLSIEARNLLP